MTTPFPLRCPCGWHGTEDDDVLNPDTLEEHCPACGAATVENDRKDAAQDAIIIDILRAGQAIGNEDKEEEDELDKDCNESNPFEPLPELSPEERQAMGALPADFVERLLRGERPLGEPKGA